MAVRSEILLPKATFPFETTHSNYKTIYNGEDFLILQTLSPPLRKYKMLLT